jgi:serine/threonine protein phosphatase PrpC
MITSGTTPYFHYWVAARPIPGQHESGDQFVVAEFEGGALLAVIDGLGHGAEAARAAKLAAMFLAEHAHESVTTLMKLCHEELRKSRGAVISMASFNAPMRTLTWLGVGNVEGLLLPADVSLGKKRVALIQRGGIVGERMLPQLHPVTFGVRPGDLLIFATDGIGSMFTQDVRHLEKPHHLVHHIFHRHAKKTDDALILGAQWTSAHAIPAMAGKPPLPASPDNPP